jgi:hypothetical protein
MRAIARANRVYHGMATNPKPHGCDSVLNRADRVSAAWSAFHFAG